MDRERLVIASRNYKKEVNKSHKAFIKNQSKKLINLRSQDPKEYWNLLNFGKKTDSIITNLSLFNHFKELTSEINSQEHNNIDITQFIQTEDTGSILDKFITAEEILKVIRNLKNNKAAGPDYILNEYIAATKELLLPRAVCQAF